MKNSSSPSSKQSAPGQDKMPTSRDVAQLAGVSQSSVCRVFDTKWQDRISPVLRDRVLAAAKELGYRPNAIARSLTAQRSGIIGIIVSENANEFYSEILRLITNELQQMGMRTMVFNAEPYRDIEQVFNELVEYRVDGIIATAAAISTQAEPFQGTLSTPLVLVNIYTSKPFCSGVITDNYTGSYQMATYLYECGCRNFAYISAENSLYFDIPDRRHGFLDGLADKGCTVCRIFAGDYSYESGKEIARQMFSSPTPPDCVFSSGSRMAYGIMDVARYEFGISIPDQLSVAAYDDTFASQLDSYRLTAVQQPSEELAHTAIRLLCQELDGRSSQIETVYAAPSLKIRGSVRSPYSSK